MATLDHCMCKCLCVGWGCADAASRCNDDEAVFIVVAAESPAASRPGWWHWSVVTTHI